MTIARTLAFEVASNEAGERLDKVCAARLSSEGVSRSLLARLCETGALTLGGKPAKPSARVRAGDVVRVEIPHPEPSTAEPEDIPLEVLFEDDALLVVNKPAGLVVHPARGHARGTLVNALLFHADIEEEEREGGPVRPGIVHRLDKDTSGVLVVAKKVLAREGLIQEFKTHTIERVYLALTSGLPPREITFDTLHGRHPTDRLRFTTRVREGRRAVTHVHVLEEFPRGPAALVRCELETGRTHQIRVHLAEAGYPLLGDPLYGRRPKNPALHALAEKLGRQALHAAVLGFVHPISGEKMRFEVPPPADFSALLESVRAL